MTLCTHHACQCDAADKLAAQGMPERAIELHCDDVPVRCIQNRGTCLAHLLPEPCETCAAYIAAGL